MIVTSASANKLLRSLEDEKAYLRNIEEQSCTYIVSDSELDEKPDYDYIETQRQIEEIDNKVLKIKHAINVFNTTTKLPGLDLTIDMALVKMAQLNQMKTKLDGLRKKLPKQRVPSFGKDSVDYLYINYDLAAVKEDYKKVSDQIMEIQLALDTCNQTIEFEVDIA